MFHHMKKTFPVEVTNTRGEITAKRDAESWLNTSTLRMIFDTRQRNVDQDGKYFADGTAKSWSNCEIDLPYLVEGVRQIEVVKTIVPFTANTYIDSFCVLRLSPNGIRPSNSKTALIGGRPPLYGAINTATGSTIQINSTNPSTPAQTVNMTNPTYMTSLYKNSETNIYDGALALIPLQTQFTQSATHITTVNNLDHWSGFRSVIRYHQALPSIRSFRIELYRPDSTLPTSTTTPYFNQVYLTGGDPANANNPYDAALNAILEVELTVEGRY